jgi:biopolymer transport protein ExbD
MRTPREADDDDSGQPNLTPFIDMMFILIVFFLATSRFHDAERDEAIRLAQSRSTMPISTPSNLLVINIDKDGKTLVEGHSRSLEQLENLVRERRKEKDVEVVLRADVRGYVGPLAEALEICHRLGFKTPNITYAQGE